MEQTDAGDLVKVTVGSRAIDGIVFDATGGTKVVVAMVDRERGPVMRTVELKALSERAEAGPDDRALQMLIRRTPFGVVADGLRRPIADVVPRPPRSRRR